MYICSECGQKYKLKPDYCDCGNDIFNEIEDSHRKVNILKKYDMNVFSVVFFVLCLVLSAFVLLFFPKVSEVQKHEPVVLKPISNIPSLDTFWKESSPVVVEEMVVQEEPPKEVVSTTVKKPVQNPELKKVTSPKSQNVLKPKTVNVNQTSAVQKTTPKPIVKDTSKIEVTNYKIALRKKLFSNLSVASVQGDGKCGVEFSVDENGKLINRGFTFYSDNKSVNDEVYKMMMRTPTFNPPPSGYHGEKIKLIFEFENNSFSVSFGK
ncbi:MAG: TonB C-terminal domain-containing protein [Candidatus Gastranaerophilales bacterium]|nr:TonB C-terminal domain-containing protein [Candidatus Gastranaerophilales bacterium]